MTRIRYVTSFMLRGIVAGIVLYTVPLLMGAASTATGDTTPSQDVFVAYVNNYGLIVGGLTVIYAGLGWLLRQNESKHWIAQGRRLSVIMTGAAVLGTALKAYTAGTPVSGVIVTAILGALHFFDAQVAPAPTKGTQSGKVVGPILLVLSFIGLMGIAIAGSGCAASQRTDTIKAALVAVDGARDGFLAYDRAHEQQLVAEAVSAEDARAKLAAYQAKRAKLDPMFGTAYRGIAAAELLNDNPSLTGMQAAIAQLIEALKPFLGGK